MAEETMVKTVSHIILNKYVIILLGIALLMVFGGANFLFSNPILIIFALLFIFLVIGGKNG